MHHDQRWLSLARYVGNNAIEVNCYAYAGNSVNQNFTQSSQTSRVDNLANNWWSPRLCRTMRKCFVCSSSVLELIRRLSMITTTNLSSLVETPNSWETWKRKVHWRGQKAQPDIPKVRIMRRSSLSSHSEISAYELMIPKAFGEHCREARHGLPHSKIVPDCH